MKKALVSIGLVIFVIFGSITPIMADVSSDIIQLKIKKASLEDNLYSLKLSLNKADAAIEKKKAEICSYEKRLLSLSEPNTSRVKGLTNRLVRARDEYEEIVELRTDALVEIARIEGKIKLGDTLIKVGRMLPNL